MDIEDGIIDATLWNKAKIRVLVVLKESYDGLCIEGVPTCSIPSHVAYNGGYGHTFGRVSWLMYKILDDESIAWCDAVKYAAIIDIIKDVGDNTSTKYERLATAYKKNTNDLAEQIASIAPEVIVFGNTYDLFRGDHTELPELDYGDMTRIDAPGSVFDGRIVVKLFHPAAPKRVDFDDIKEHLYSLI